LFYERLLNIEFIDLAEQCIQCLYYLSTQYSLIILEFGILGTLLTISDFFAINIQRRIVQILYNISKKINHEEFHLIEESLPTMKMIFNNTDTNSKHLFKISY
jgi:E3 ubiquitin-protein ligase TRIP12